MRRSRKFCQRGSNFDNVFCCCFFSWWWEGGSKYHYKRAIIGPPAKRHLNGVSLAGPWFPNIECWFCSFVIFSGSGPVLLFVIFQRGSGPPAPPPSGSAHGTYHITHCHRTTCHHHTLYKYYQLCKMESHWKLKFFIQWSRNQTRHAWWNETVYSR